MKALLMSWVGACIEESLVKSKDGAVSLETIYMDSFDVLWRIYDAFCFARNERDY
jgi:hypothetical protein